MLFLTDPGSWGVGVNGFRGNLDKMVTFLSKVNDLSESVWVGLEQDDDF